MLRAWRAAPWALRLVAVIAPALLLWAGVNWTCHVMRKPTELLAPLSPALVKTPAQTWQEYGPHFRRHATAVITPEFLAALAQVESSGNPLARTYWRWQPAWHPFEAYRPASSAVGMYQITDGTFVQARPRCAPGLAAEADGCWFDSLYTRTMPEEAIALTARYLDGAVADVLRRTRPARASPGQKRSLAGVIHLCGAAAGARFASRGFRVAPGERCGDHALQAYLARLDTAVRHFQRLAGAGRLSPVQDRSTPR